MTTNLSQISWIHDNNHANGVLLTVKKIGPKAPNLYKYSLLPMREEHRTLSIASAAPFPLHDLEGDDQVNKIPASGQLKC